MKENLQTILLHSLLNEEIGQLIRTVSNYLGYPVMLTDVGYSLINHYPEKPLGDPLWDVIHESGFTPPEYVGKLHAQKMMQLGGNNIEPYYLDWGFLEKYPRIIMNLCSKHKHYGYLAILCEDHSEAMLEMVRLIGKVCVLALQKNDTETLASTDYQTMFLKCLFDENGLKKEQLKSWIQNMPVSISGSYYVGCCSFKQKQDAMQTYSFIQMALKKAYPGIFCYAGNREINFLFTSIRDEKHVITIINMLREALADYKLRFGVSNPFDDLEKARVYLKQAKHSLKIAEINKCVYVNYKDCMLEQFLSVIYRGLPKESCIHNSIFCIMEYDRKNGTQYFETLKVYVKSWFHSKQTIEELHIHRNTLPHRLEMIEKIGDINLHDSETRTVLMLNFNMDLEVDYMEG